MLFILGMGCLWCEAQNNALSERKWLPFMEKAMERETYHYEDGSYYKGQLSGEVPSGLGVYLSRNGSWYWGRWKDGEWNGKGMYISPESSELLDCQGCVYYVGDWSSDRPSGTGTCYDKYGKLIYHGGFSDGRPTEAYPSTGYAGYTFECVECGGGNIYVGEKKDGVRHGYGVYLKSDGGAWYGPWKEGKREGYGISMPYKEKCRVGCWTGDYYKETACPENLYAVSSADEVFTKVRTGKASSVSGNKRSGQEEWERAISFYNAKNYKKALPLLRRFAESGNADAQYYLGGCYYYGQDNKNAAKWWRKAADQGNADAQLAWLLLLYTQRGEDR